MLLGQIKDMQVGDRDAIHAAIVWASCAQYVNPGTPVRFTDFDAGICERCTPDVMHGIADPFGDSVSKEFAVILDPSVVDGPLFHNFDIKGAKNEQRGSGYNAGYSKGHDEDDGCRGC